jgi:hypothetical protein
MQEKRAKQQEDDEIMSVVGRVTVDSLSKGKISSGDFVAHDDVDFEFNYLSKENVMRQVQMATHHVEEAKSHFPSEVAAEISSELAGVQHMLSEPQPDRWLLLRGLNQVRDLLGRVSGPESNRLMSEFVATIRLVEMTIK